MSMTYEEAVMAYEEHMRGCEQQVMEFLERENDPMLWCAAYDAARENSPLEALYVLGEVKAYAAVGAKPEDGDFRDAVRVAASRFPNLPEAQQAAGQADLLTVLEKYNHPRLWYAAYVGAQENSPLEALCAFGRMRAYVALGTKPEDDGFQTAVQRAARTLPNLPEAQQEQKQAALLDVLGKHNHPDIWGEALDGAYDNQKLKSIIKSKREELGK